MSVLKKLTKKVENSKIVKNPKFLVIGLIIIIVLITLIYFIFLKYSPIMNFKYEGYAISGKEITENLLSGESSENNANKNIELAKIEEQGTIFKKLNDYFVGSKEKTEINLNYPIYINGNSSLYNLSEGSTLISKDFEEISGYPNLSISEGKIYDGNNLERADAKEYIFVKTTDNIYINLYEIKVKTTANEYTIPVNSLIAFIENSVRYYSIKNNVLVFNQINDIDDNSNVEMVENNYIYKELLTRLGILQEESNNTESSNSQENIIQENTANKEIKDDNETNNNEQQNTDNNTNEQNEYIKPEVRAENFTAEVYTAKSTLHIKDPSGRIVEAPTFEIYKDGKIYLRRTFSNSGEIQITGLIPDTEYEVIGKYIYLNENNQKVENTFYEGTFTTKGYEQLGSIEIQKENGEIFSNKIQLTKVKITSDLNAEVLKGVNQVEIETGEIRTVLSNSKVISLLRGEEITLETSGGLESDSTIKYTIKFYDKNGIELKVNNGEGETKTSKEKPTVRVNIKEQDIVSVTLGLKLTNRDNVELENYKYVVTRPNGEIVQEKKLSVNENELLLEDLDQNQYYKISIYADYDLNDNRGKQEQVEIGNLVFATQPISTLGSLELTVENKELTSTTSTVSYKINEDRTDKRLIQILNELTINIVEQPEGYGDNNKQETKEGTVVYTDILTGEEITNLQQAGTKEIKYENLKSNTTYTIEITGNVQLGNTQEEVPITYNYKEFTTLKNPAKVEIRNQFVTGNLIDFDVRIEDIDNSVLNNTVRMELRDSKDNLIDLQKLTTNEDYIRKTYEKLTENQTYSLRFYADQYNEGSTDETYKVNYLIKEIEIVTEPGISGSIGLTELSKKATGKNLIDMSSETKWYVYPNFNTDDYYGKEYNAETKILILGGHGNTRRAVYDLREYAGQEVTMSFKAKAVSGSQTAYIQNSKTDTNRTLIQGLTTDWKDFQYTLTIDSTGYLGFYIERGSGIEIQELQVELGNKKTSYEEFKYTLQSSYNINLEDKRDEIPKNDYYIKIYEDNNLISTDRYEEIPEENVITNVMKTYETQIGKQYKVELVIKIRDREYVISELEYNTQDTEEIKGIYNKEDFLEIQQRGHYIVLEDIDLRGGLGAQYRFGNGNMYFEGVIDFNGHILDRDAQTMQPIFSRTSDKAILKNLQYNIRLNNTIEISGFRGFVEVNYGKLSNIQINLIESNSLPNNSIYLLTTYNYGTIDKFILNFVEPLYGSYMLAGIAAYNYGIISNGYCYGQNIQTIYTNTRGNSYRSSAPICAYSQNGSKIFNVYSLVSVDTKGAEGGFGEIANVAGKVESGASIKNAYSVGIGDTYNLSYGPSVYSFQNTENVENLYYFADITFNNKYNKKSTPLALWDTTFQNQILNDKNAFNIDDLVTQGYYPQLNWPDCMPPQEYLELPEVEDKDLADILSMEVMESTKDTAKVKFSVNNPSGETVTNIEINRLRCTIESQEYKDGKSEVIAILDNPTMYLSEYSVLGITTKGAYNLPYTRNFSENERLINIDFYKEINTTDDWKDINKSPSENYILMQDLDFRNNSEDSIIRTYYTGKLDGNNHTIKNIINTKSQYIFVRIKNKLSNLNIENCEFAGSYSTGFIDYIEGDVENVHIKNIKLSATTNITSPNIGALAGVAINGVSIKNCSVSNVEIKLNSYSTNVRVGGLIGVANLVEMSNCYAQNVDINISNSTYEGVGGLVGASETKSTFKNCYSTGKIKTDAGTVGGILGLFNNGTLENSYSYVNITGSPEDLGGLIGKGGSSVTVKDNLALGNLYTNTSNAQINRLVGTGMSNFSNNYAYLNQKINGFQNNEDAGIDLLTSSELLQEKTYMNILNFDDSYNYERIEEGILPKLNKVDTDEILPYQDDIHLVIIEDFTLGSLVTEKTAVDRISGQVILENPNNLEITGIEIDGMDCNVTQINNKNGKVYVNFEATPNKYYDVYKLTKVIYIKNGERVEQEVEGRIEIQFYKDIYTFEDWQTIDSTIPQNYRIMNDIDFSGRANINANITVLRLEGANENITLKNIDLSNTGMPLIEAVNISIKNINFDNIKIETNETISNVGIIAMLRGTLDKVNFNEVDIIANNATNVGCIGYTIGVSQNVILSDVNVSGKTQVGGLVGYGYADIQYIQGNNLTVTGTSNYVAGIVGYTQEDVLYVEVSDVEISGNNYIGGILGCLSFSGGAKYSHDLVVKNSNISGKDYVGGIKGYIGSHGEGKNEIYDSNVTGIGSYIGGIVGADNGAGESGIKVEDCTIKGIGTKSDYVGGITGKGNGNTTCNYVRNTTIESTGSYIGGLKGNMNTPNTLVGNYIENVIIRGYSEVGGLFGSGRVASIYKNYVFAIISAENSNAGGVVGKLKNENMTAVDNNSSIYYNYVANSKINAKSNVGGLVGNIVEDLYMPENYYYSNFIEAYLESEDDTSISLGIGNRADQNQYLKDTYYYKYSSINGENPNVQNEVFIPQDKYLVEAELKQQSTYTSKLKWNTGQWDFTSLVNNKYPTIKDDNLSNQDGINLPIDSEHIIENNVDITSLEIEKTTEKLEETFEYDNKEIETYSTYSVITADDGSKVTRNAKLYVKDNNLYAIPIVISAEQASNYEEIVPVANNLILDSYNGKEYETVLGSDGKIYDLKKPIEYPENFVNSDIEGIGNNLNNSSHEIEVLYKNGDKIKFNYQTGEVISSSESDTSDGVGLFDYLVEKISEIGSSSSDVSQELANKYEESKELLTKLEETSVEEAIEKQNNSNYIENGVTAIENNEANNSLKENKYISMYNEETGQYEIYDEEELLDTSKEEVVSENEKIEANNLSEYYASEGETRNTKVGIVWIVLSIIGVGIILFVLGKKIGIRGRS